MRYLKIALLALLPVSMFANQIPNQALPLWHAGYYTGTNILQDDDSTIISNSDSQVTIVEHDSTKSISLSFHSNNSDTEEEELADYLEQYNDVNITIIEGEGSTKIILYNDNGDTIKNFEMNFDNSGDVEFSSTTKKENDIPFFNKKSDRRFKGHWSGFEMGLNNYMTPSFGVSPENEYMEINTGTSWNFNLNFAQYSIPFVRDRFGLVTGLGIEWNNYQFSNQNSITKSGGSPNTIIEKDLTNVALKKNRLQTTYLTAPILLEIQLGEGVRDNRVSVSAGIITGLKLGSHTKVKTNESKEKVKNDFYLQSFRYGFTARVNYDNFGLFFNYYNTPMFIEDKGPEELHPFAAGVVLSFN